MLAVAPFSARKGLRLSLWQVWNVGTVYCSMTQTKPLIKRDKYFAQQGCYSCPLSLSLGYCHFYGLVAKENAQKQARVANNQVVVGPWYCPQFEGFLNKYLGICSGEYQNTTLLFLTTRRIVSCRSAIHLINRHPLHFFNLICP
jgi:hypothetical protein